MINKGLASFIVTFNRPKVLIETIRSICSQTVSPGKVLVVNNGDYVALEDLEFSGIELEQVTMGANGGPAAAAYFALKKLVEEKYEWIQWVDDDDPPRFPDLNEKLFAHLDFLRDDSIGIIAPVGSFFNENRGAAVRVTDDQIRNSKYLYVDTVAGNQCMVINKKVVQAGCLPIPELFFGFEETSFCLKVIKAGYRIVIPTDLFSLYRTAANRWGLTKADIRKIRTPAWRTYYSNRNLLYMFSHEFKKPASVVWIIARILARAFYCFFFRRSNNDSLELMYTLRAIRDGLTKRLGMTVMPEPKRY